MRPIISSWKALSTPFARKAGSVKKDSAQLRFCGAAICGPGKVRTQNQDNLYLNGIIRKKPNCTAAKKPCLRLMVAVADGMGGEAHGDLASLATVKLLKKTPPRDEGTMHRLMLEANEEICEMMRRYGERIGSTLTMLCLQGKTARMTNIGDSRCYLFRDGQLRAISKDHTQVRQMVDMGLLTPEQARTHRDRHKLTQHLGIFPDEMLIEPEMVELEVCAGDLFLLCSDGLTDMVEDASIAQVLKSEKMPKEKAEELFAQAMENGGRDNITVLLVAVCG